MSVGRHESAWLECRHGDLTGKILLSLQAIITLSQNLCIMTSHSCLSIGQTI